MLDGPPEYALDAKGYPVPIIERRRLTPGNAREVHPQDIALRRLFGAMLGPGIACETLGVDRGVLSLWLRGEHPLPSWAIDRLIELAREHADGLAALAVRLETVDRPVYEERRRQVRLRARERFRDRFGYYPEERQVMRTLPPSGQYPSGRDRVKRSGRRSGG